MRRVRVEMLIDGKPVKKIRHNGKTYLPVPVGRNFEINISNDSHERICAVISVDGLSVMTGEEASHDATSGYIYGVGQSYSIKGWRTDDNNVQLFEVVTAEGETYSERIGKGSDNKGVIGVALYPEKRKQRVRSYSVKDRGYRDFDEYHPTGAGVQSVLRFDETKTCGFTDRCGADREARRVEHEELTCGGIVLPDEPVVKHAGAGWGEKAYDPVREVEFKVDKTRKSLVVLYYDTEAGLRDRGVPVYNEPDPFPAEPSRTYCPRPRN